VVFDQAGTCTLAHVEDCDGYCLFVLVRAGLEQGVSPGANKAEPKVGIGIDENFEMSGHGETFNWNFSAPALVAWSQ
jgi:hypothetical protein